MGKHLAIGGALLKVFVLRLLTVFALFFSFQILHAGERPNVLFISVAVTSAVNSGVPAATARVAFGMIEEENAAECGDVCSASPQ